MLYASSKDLVTLYHLTMIPVGKPSSSLKMEMAEQ